MNFPKLQPRPQKKLATIICILVSWCSFTAVAQQQVSVQGRVIDKTQQPVPYASVALLNTGNAAIVKTAPADSAGKFTFSGVIPGNYTIAVTAIGFKDNRNTIFEIKDQAANISLPDILLESSEVTISGVTVTGRKPLIEFRPDRTVLNVASSITSTGSNAFELLRKAPGVRIAGEDDITLSGKNGLTVYMNGKASNLTGKELIDFLKNTPSAAIESIEIITNPSAKYDAAGNAGIIDIKTKKNSNYGFNGNLSLTSSFGSYNPKYDGGLNFNYRQKKFNLYGAYNYYTGNYRTKYNYLKRQFSQNDWATLNQDFINYSSNHGHNYKGGVDFYVSSKSTVGVLVEGNTTNSRTMGDSRTIIEQPGNDIDSLLISTNRQPQDNNRINYNLNYRYSDSTGKELTVDGDYGKYSMNSNSYQPNFYLNKGGAVNRERTYYNITATDISIYSFKADYKQKLGSGNLSGGIKYSDVKSDNNLLFYNVKEGTNYLDTGRTNHFVYKEKIQAAYLTYDITLNKWSLQAGARLEHTDSKGTLTTLSKAATEAVDTSYLNIFPNAVVSYQVNDKHKMSLSYNRRVNRPGYSDLNPFEFVLDELTFYKGNPFLRPQFTDNIKLTHIFNDMLTSSLSYSNNKGYVISYIDTVDLIKSFESNINMFYQKIYSFNTTLQLPVESWWDMMANFEINHVKVRGIAARDLLEISQTAYVASNTHTFKLPDSWSMELSGYYNSRYLSGAYSVDPQWSVDAGIQKKILKGNGVCKLNVTDVFNSLKAVNVRDFAGYYIKANAKWETRQLRLSFNYRFGNKNVKGETERRTSSAEEQGRAH